MTWLAEEHRESRIRVNLVVPAPRTASGMVEAMGAPATASPADVARTVASLLAPTCTETETVIDLGTAT